MDYVAAVTATLNSLQAVCDGFHKLEKFANLHLNLRKTQVNPLGLQFSLQSLEAFTGQIKASLPLLAGTKARFLAEYLGLQ